MTDTLAARAQKAEIRAWAAQQGYIVPEHGRIPTAVRAAWTDAHPQPVPDDRLGEVGEQVGEEPAGLLDGFGPVEPERPPALALVADDGQGDEQGGMPGEVRPQEPRRRRLTERLRGGRGEQGSRGGRRRTSVANLVSAAWGVAGQLAGDMAMRPTAAVLTYQAPVAGALVDGMVKGTLIDRALQPLARMGDGGEALFALLAPPILVTAISRDPQGMGPRLMPLLRRALVSWADIAGPEIVKMQKREKARKESGFDVDALLALIFEDQTEDTPGT
jgi:hypothetical protein